ncbi:MAG: ATP synthase F1 subunit delta [bacterium]|nr:ATP synthase F1 subunit delta [bacterium]
MTITATHYARALGEFAGDAASFDRAVGDLETFAGILEREPAIAAFFSRSGVSSAQREQVIRGVVQDRVSTHAFAVIRMLVTRRALSLLRAIISSARERGGVVHAMVTSAIPLRTEQQERIVTQLREQLGGEVRAEFTEDRAIIGGLRVLINDSRLWDGTVAGRFRRIRRHLALHTR